MTDIRIPRPRSPGGGVQSSDAEAHEHPQLSELLSPELREKAHERLIERMLAHAAEEQCEPGGCGENGALFWARLPRHAALALVRRLPLSRPRPALPPAGTCNEATGMCDCVVGWIGPGCRHFARALPLPRTTVPECRNPPLTAAPPHPHPLARRRRRCRRPARTVPSCMTPAGTPWPFNIEKPTCACRKEWVHLLVRTDRRTDRRTPLAASRVRHSHRFGACGPSPPRAPAPPQRALGNIDLSAPSPCMDAGDADPMARPSPPPGYGYAHAPRPVHALPLEPPARACARTGERGPSVLY